ncbi:MAG: hypothetical protein EA383_08520, partial [Spirochaetaceae bacterium]
DSTSVASALSDAQRAIDDVEKLKAQLAEKKKKRNLAVHVLEETYKAAKHARRAQQARDKADAPPKAPKTPKASKVKPPNVAAPDKPATAAKKSKKR